VDRVEVRLLQYAIVCLAIGMVTGAMRATTLPGVLRETLKHFVALAGGIALLAAMILLLTLVAQA
jgi:hypothetical protein